MRLSVQPVTPKEFECIVALSKKGQGHSRRLQQRFPSILLVEAANNVAARLFIGFQLHEATGGSFVKQAGE